VGGPGGTTTVTTSVMNSFRSNGATKGNAGQKNGDATNFLYCGVTGTAPIATVLTGPTKPSTTSTTGTFTFQATEPGITEAGVTLGEGAVTFECSLDGATFTSCSSPFTIPTASGIGHHIFTVIATDLSGNKEPGPPFDVVSIWEWDVVGLDGGIEDAQSEDHGPALDLGVDAGAEDSAGEEVPPALLDAEAIDEGVDALASDDILGGLDAGKPDVASDVFVPVGRDTRPNLSVDGEGADLRLTLLDSGAVLDVQVPLVDGAAVEVLADTKPTSDADANPDTAAGQVVIDDAAVPTAKKDAAPQSGDFKVLGSGFCSIASSRSTTAMPFMVMALAVLALFFRRRREP
jgi:hypothetical protein